MTRKHLLGRRRHENLESLQAKYDKWKAAQPSLVPPDPTPVFDGTGGGETWSAIQHDRKVTFRKNAGLEPLPIAPNPDREGLTPSLAYVENPLNRTRSELIHRKKERLLGEHDASLKHASLHFRSALQRLEERENALHLMRDLAPKGKTRSELVQQRRDEIQSDLHETFGGKDARTHQQRAQREVVSDRPGFWTLQTGYTEAPLHESLSALRNSRTTRVEPTSEEHFLSESHSAFKVDGFVPMDPEAAIAAEPVVRHPKAPQSTAIRNKAPASMESEFAKKNNEATQNRDMYAPMYSSFSPDKTFSPKSIIPYGRKSAKKEGKRSKKRDAQPLSDPDTMITALSRTRPYTCTSLIDTGTKVRTGGFQLVQRG